MVRGGVQHVMLMVVLGSVATCAVMITTVLSGSEDFRRNFQDEKYDKTFTNSNQTKVTRSISVTVRDTLILPDIAADFTD